MAPVHRSHRVSQMIYLNGKVGEALNGKVVFIGITNDGEKKYIAVRVFDGDLKSKHNDSLPEEQKDTLSKCLWRLLEIDAVYMGDVTPFDVISIDGSNDEAMKESLHYLSNLMNDLNTYDFAQDIKRRNGSDLMRIDARYVMLEEEEVNNSTIVLTVDGNEFSFKLTNISQNPKVSLSIGDDNYKIIKEKNGFPDFKNPRKEKNKC